jgi:hypothetical protein
MRIKKHGYSESIHTWQHDTYRVIPKHQVIYPNGISHLEVFQLSNHKQAWPIAIAQGEPKYEFFKYNMTKEQLWEYDQSR